MVYTVLQVSGVASVSCSGVKPAGAEVSFTTENYYASAELYARFETAFSTVGKYEITLTVTMENGPEYTLNDAFRFIDDSAGGA